MLRKDDNAMEFNNEREYIDYAIKNNRGSILTGVANDVSEEDSKPVKQLVSETPNNLDEEEVSKIFSELLQKGYIEPNPFKPEKYITRGSVEDIERYLNDRD